MVIKLTEMTKKGNLVFLRHLCNDIFSCHSRKSTGVTRSVNGANSREYLHVVQLSVLLNTQCKTGKGFQTCLFNSNSP